MKKLVPFILSLAVGLLLLPIPLLRDFHFESAMLAAVAGCIWAGFSAADRNSNQDFFATLRILGFLYLAAIPLFVYSLITACLTIDGIAFWLLTPIPSAYLGAAIGRLLRKLWFPFPKTLTVLILLFCAIGVWLYEFLNFPQVYFYNHVWGIWPGPIYDESVTISGTYLFFRSITFLWIILLWILPAWNDSLKNKLIFGFSALALFLSYLNLSEMGVISPNEEIQRRLGSNLSTEHFEIYFDDRYYNATEINYWALKHEWYFQEITGKLEISWPEGRKIESYLYPHAWAKKNITGAKFTSYVPIWLEQDQLHIAKQQLHGVLKHELVHVISKQFGNDLFNGSWSIGLIEGLAEGIAQDASSESTLNQIVASETPYPTAEEIEKALSFSGFYSSAGAVSYTTSGSFAGYLLDTYPVQFFKTAYYTGDIENAYQDSFENLVAGWRQHLQQTEIDSLDQQISEFIFAQRSLFEKTCPHSVPEELKIWDEYHFLLADQDTSDAYQKLDHLYSINPQNKLVHAEWIRSQLTQGFYKKVLSGFSPDDTLLTIQILHADAFMLNGSFPKADSTLQSFASAIKSSPAKTFRYSLEIRADSLLWMAHVNRRYKKMLPGRFAFEQLNLPNKMLSLGKTLDLNSDSSFIQYSRILLENSINPDWFDIYEQQIDRLIYLGEMDLSLSWIERLSSQPLRARYRQRLAELKSWHSFLDSQPE